MNIKRALGIISLAGIVVSIVYIIEFKLFGIYLKGMEPAEVSNTAWYASMIFAAALSALLATWHFKSPKTIPGAINGFLFGVLAAVAGLASDVVAFAVHEGGLGILSKYYVEPRYWAAFALIMASATLVGYIKGRKRG